MASSPSSSKRPPLPEKKFINESFGKNPYPFWLWLAITAAIAGIIWGSGFWFQRVIHDLAANKPFLEVTNRDFSLFLWENTSLMRPNVQSKTGYLSAYGIEDIQGMDFTHAEEYVEAPPEVLFLYHTWHRLIGNTYFHRAISPNEFLQFLAYAKEWDPSHWSKAPQAYIDLIKNLPNTPEGNLDDLPTSTLPIEVRKAFQGWKNYFVEGKEIAQLRITYGMMKDFLSANPYFQRNYWRNIHIHYLEKTGEKEGLIPNENVPVFLRLALYNDLKSKEQKKK